MKVYVVMQKTPISYDKERVFYSLAECKEYIELVQEENSDVTYHIESLSGTLTPVNEKE